MKRLALVGVVLVLGSGAAFAQLTADPAKGGGDGVETAIRPSAAENRTEGSDILIDVTLHGYVGVATTADVDVTLALAVAGGSEGTIIPPGTQMAKFVKHSGVGTNAQPRSVLTTFRVSTLPDDGAEDDTIELTLSGTTAPWNALNDTIMVKLDDPDTQSYTLAAPTATASDDVEAGTAVNLEFKSSHELEATTTNFRVTLTNAWTLTTSSTFSDSAGDKVDETITVTPPATADDGDSARVAVYLVPGGNAPDELLRDIGLVVGSPVGSSGTPTGPTGPTTTGDKGQITEFKLVGDVVDKTIAGVRRHHVPEGSQGVDLSVTVQWTHEEIAAIGYSTWQYIDVEIMSDRGTRPLPNWLSWMDTDGQDVHFPRTAGFTGRVGVRTPRLTEVPVAQRGSPRHVMSRTGALDVLIIHDDHEAEKGAALFRR